MNTQERRRDHHKAKPHIFLGSYTKAWLVSGGDNALYSKAAMYVYHRNLAEGRK